ncbi:sensor histidine kinase [Psychrilyobacter atlanticus]|uniref:sensor histidine kinase n=1 Tax=Psychrilyobacter atlanticus TaxID=271091 RepID=UPI0003FFEDE2|nr:HAMP domain-containing sensor histidine kinase [Psychrilyobacter atlanticus]
MFQKFKTIKMNIIFTYAVVFVGTLLFLNILIYQLSSKMIINIKKDTFYTNKEFFLENIKDLEEKNIVMSKKKLEIEINKVRSHSRDFYISILNPNGIEVGEIPRDINLDSRQSNEIVLLEGKNHEEYFYLNEVRQYNGNDYMFQYLLITDYEEYFKVLMQVLIIIELLSIFIAIFLGIRIGNKVIRPINRISDMTEKITAENLDQRLPIGDQPDEISRLSKLINTMFERLDQSFDDQKNFVSNISHELRTPIAVMKGYLDLYRKVGPDNKELLEEAMTAIEEENESMNRMIEKLLFMARKDLENFKLNIDIINIENLFKKLKNDYSSIEESGGLKTFVEAGSSLKCDQDILIQILRALIDNAIKYGENKGIELGYYESNIESIIYVKDYGSGIDSDEVGKIFDRFYKGDKSRNRDNGSVGLGLSIVKKLTELHGCEVNVKSKLGEGTTFEIIFIKMEE